MSKKKDSKKKDSRKKDSKKKKSKKDAVVEVDQFTELVSVMKGLTKEVAKLQKSNESLKAELSNLKNTLGEEDVAPKVITKVMEPQVLPPSKPTRKPTRKTTTTSTTRAKTSPKPKAAPAAKAPKPAKATTPERPASQEDLRFVQGLGAKIESLMIQEGIKTFADLARASQAKVKGVLEQSGPRFKNQDPKPLIEQAKLIKAENWEELEAYQAKLMEGRKKPGPKVGSRRKA